MQKDATLLAKNTQHCWMLYVASVCFHTLLHVAACCWKVLRKVWNWSNVSYVQTGATTPNTNVGSCCIRLHARYSFSRSIPPKFGHKLRRHKQRFGKIATTVVLDKDENLLGSGLQWHRSCHSNEMTSLPILLAAVYLGTGNFSSKIVISRVFFPPIAASMFVKFKRNLQERYRDILGWRFYG